MSPLVAGVDCSTQATKVLVVDADTGSVVATGRAPHEVTGSGGARETDPEVWWRALRSALGQTGRAGELAAISVAGQQHGLVVTDADGRPLRPAILWNDTRSAPQAAELTRGARRPSRVGGADRARPGAFVHGHALGLAARQRTGGGGRRARRAAATRLPDREALRPRGDRPRRRLRHGLVVDAGRALLGRGARADRPRPDAVARRARPVASPRARSAGRRWRSSVSPPAGWWAPGRATTWAPRWAWAPRRASRW